MRYCLVGEVNIRELGAWYSLVGSNKLKLNLDLNFLNYMYHPHHYWGALGKQWDDQGGKLETCIPGKGESVPVAIARG